MGVRCSNAGGARPDPAPRLCYLPQEPQLDPEWTVRDSVDTVSAHSRSLRSSALFKLLGALATDRFQLERCHQGVARSSGGCGSI